MSIAGSDPSGGAGIQADLKTFAALGAYGTTVVTALTAQSTTGVTGVHPVPAQFVREQLETLLDDVPVDAVKVGMLGSAEVVDVVASVLGEHPALVAVVDGAGVQVPIVLDPVMVSTSGSRLLEPEAEDALRRLLRIADVVTPNLPEAAVLLGAESARDLAEMRAQAAALHDLGARRVLLKGGHLDGPESVDVWSDAESGEVVELTSRRVRTANTHGTGCTLSSAIAALRPRHDEWLPAVRAAKDYLTGALEHADDLTIGAGPGPVNHAWLID
ncbi:phosphomethylpyrimidine kinase [Knoellia sinensis KCTC 19936]|uniref:Phosphomethylpyrimidine kinase n=1 Tax=Knoellia sinensis KCTC 19936 TaxID=1385520 RepID=A0A0A0J7P8_9MICO|nr:phosphomethylpyrimidine kinase [Knoellia sinensis KCTC 19936]